MSKEKSLVLLSGGLDSSVNLHLAIRKFDVVLALTFDYEQVAAKNEIQVSKRICEKYQIKHEIISLKFFKDISKSGLHSSQIPVQSEISISDLEQSKKSADQVWVPNRNGVFLNVAAAIAEGLDIRYVIPGFNKEEAQTFPDNSENFLSALNDSFYFSTRGKVKVQCLTTQLTKTEIVAEAKRSDFDFSMIWPCYKNLANWCGECESCLRTKNAFSKNGLDLKYLKNRL